MKRFISACLALASVCLAESAVHGARPRYGGMLRVEIDSTIRSLDPAATASDAGEAAARRRALGLVFETLVAAEADGLRPVLATAWESDPRGARWQFRLRSGVQLHDGSPLESWQVATALRASEPAWTIATDGDTVVINTGEPIRDLPWVLADLRHAVVIRASGGMLVGTGPFQIERLEPARLSLRAHDRYWAGRPFVDAVRVDMARSRASQLSDLEGGRADIVSATPLDARRITQRGLHVAASRPIEVVALVFEPHRSADAALAWRRTLATALNRPSMCAVLLQRLAEPADALVPRWLSGYAPLFALDPKPTLSRAAIAALPVDQRELTIRVEASDALAQAIADRIAVDGREAGLTIKVQAPAGLAPRPDARVMRVNIPATSPDRALAAVAGRLTTRDLVQPVAATLSPAASLESVYDAEQKLIDRAVVVPVVHVPEIYGLSDRVGTWNAPAVRASGAWNFADVWLRGGTP
jgi:MarR-like DNA-binding transcriptional regulator SgrR of sgrS sRNA